MTTPDEQWWDAQAGEYVLGTLRGRDRDIFKRILITDEEVRKKVSQWQEWLSPLDALTDPVVPPAELLPRILLRIAAPQENTADIDLHGDSQDESADASIPHSAQPSEPRGGTPDTASHDPPSDSTAHTRTDNVVAHPRRSRSWRRSNALWKGTAALATAASIALAALLVQSLNQRSTPEDPARIELSTVSVVQNDEREALWLLTTGKGSDQLRIVALAPPPVAAEKSYQLWMVKPDDGGVNSVGLMPVNAGESRSLTLPIATKDAQLFAVSLEPAGGSPEPVPTGPVLFSGSIITVSSNNF
jgi:anti-sigma-K factor RskA